MIHESEQTFLPVAVGLFENQWIAHIGDQVVTVLAGSKSDLRYSDQGIVVVLVEDTNHHTLSGPDTYETPLRAGLVKVVDGVGQVLTLQAEDGTLFYFDVPSRQWVS